MGVHRGKTRPPLKLRSLCERKCHIKDRFGGFGAPGRFRLAEMCNFKPQVVLNIDEVWEIKRRTFEILAAQKHLWAYYERIALQRGMQAGAIRA